MLGYPPLVFDSKRLPDAGRREFLREEFGRKVLRVELQTPSERPLEFRMGAASLGEVSVAWIDGTAHANTRNRSMLSDGDDRFSVVVPLKGRYLCGNGDDRLPVKRGELMALRCDSTGGVCAPSGGTFLTVLAPRAMMAGVLGHNGFSYGQARAMGKPGLDLLLAYLRFAGASTAGVASAVQADRGRQFAELLSAVAAGTLASEAALRAPGTRAAQLAALLADIDGRFTVADFNIGTCASSLGMSVRQAQTVLEEAGTTFSVELKRRRLERARQLLSNPALAHLRVTDIALDCWFSDISHFNRVFRAHFGDTPTGLRAS